MPTVRRPLVHGALPRLTEEVISAFARIEAIRVAGGHERWEDEGGARREWLDLSARLDAALGIFPHQWGVSDVPSTGPLPEGCRDVFHSFEAAQQLRRALEAAVRERRAAAEAAGAPKGRSGRPR